MLKRSSILSEYTDVSSATIHRSPPESHKAPVFIRRFFSYSFLVYTMKDCCAATSVEGQEAAYEHTFGMFSFPTTSDVSITCA